MLLLRAATIATAVVLATGPSAGEENTTSKSTGIPSTTQVHKGDQWSYDYTDETTGQPSATITYTITELTDSDVTTRITRLGGGAPFTAIFDRNWNTKEDNLFLNKPNDGLGIELPLSVGKEWKITGSNKNVSVGTVFRHTGKSKVVLQEKITNQAGTYDTFKISTDIVWQTQNSSAKKIEIHAETWYAPEIDRIVKRTYVSKYAGHVNAQFSMELIDFSSASN